nr:hypothetical protein GCM10025732_21470 [Glycomyces mayteni]
MAGVGAPPPEVQLAVAVVAAAAVVAAGREEGAAAAPKIPALASVLRETPEGLGLRILPSFQDYVRECMPDVT